MTERRLTPRAIDDRVGRLPACQTPGDAVREPRHDRHRRCFRMLRLLVVALSLLPSALTAQEDIGRPVQIDIPGLMAGRGGVGAWTNGTLGRKPYEELLASVPVAQSRGPENGWKWVFLTFVTSTALFTVGAGTDALAKGLAGEDPKYRWWFGGFGLALGTGLTVFMCSKRGCRWNTGPAQARGRSSNMYVHPMSFERAAPRWPH